MSVCLGFRKWAIQRYIPFFRVISIFCCEHGFNSVTSILEKDVKNYFLKFGFEYLIIFSYCANKCLCKVVDSKILCLFTLVFKACNVCNFSKK